MAELIDRYLSAADLDRIEKAVASAEARTDGEIAVVLEPQSRPWPVDRLLISSALGIVCLVAFALLTRQEIWGTHYRFMEAAVAGLVAFGVAYVLLTFWLTQPPQVKQAVFKRALRHFENLAPTRACTAVLIYVSLSEREAAVIADRGIAGKVPADFWQQPCDYINRALRAGRCADGMVDAITQIGTELAAHFPRSSDDTDELPNRPEIA